MRYFRFVITLAILGLLGNEVAAQGTIGFSAGYPAPGANAKEIYVKGAVNLDKNWTVAKITLEMWEEKSTVTGSNVPFLANGQFTAIAGAWDKATIIAPKANTTYKMNVTAYLVNGGMAVTVRCSATVNSK
jgi:hypothetical protein